jgi:hypothetical protein
MRFAAFALALLLPACGGGGPSQEPVTLADELGFRQMRQNFHLAKTTGDRALMRSLWAEDAVLTTGSGAVYVGPDAITDYIASNPSFGKHLLLTSESAWAVRVQGDDARYGFESISVDVGENDPRDTVLSVAGSQNPDVEIVEHTHSSGVATRVEEGRWVFKELNGGGGPLTPVLPESAGVVPAEVEPGEFELSVGDAVAFRRLREDFHVANLLGDSELMRTVWADDGVFVTGGGVEYVGGDVITDFFASGPNFGKFLTLTPEASLRMVVNGDIVEYGFECISVFVGTDHPLSVDLCTKDGSQNPSVEIVSHTNSTGLAQRVAEGRWVFKEFNGGKGPLLPAAGK